MESSASPARAWRALRNLAIAGSLAVAAGCGDNRHSSGSPDAAAPEELCQIAPSSSSASGRDGVASRSHAIIYYNGLPTQPPMFNALTTNPEALTHLIDNRLHTSVYDTAAGDAADPVLVAQLDDPWAETTFAYLVACALNPEQSISWTSPSTGDTRAFRGERGFCPAWSDTALRDIAETDSDSACPELVSGCLLASNNALGGEVRVSMRGNRDGEALSWEAAVASTPPRAELAELAPCEAGQSDESCGWSPGYVGTCGLGEEVEIVADEEVCTATTAVRACRGLDACGAADALDASSDICAQDGLSFTCPTSGRFALMTARPVEPDAPPLLAPRSRWPVSEGELFTRREGAFYGNVLDAEALDPRISVRVTGGAVVYSFTPDPALPATEYIVYELACNGISLTPFELRAYRHERFLDGVKDVDLSEDIIIHSSMHSCSDPGWSDGAAYLSERLCAGAAGWKFCMAKTVGPCWAGGGRDNHCQLEDSGASESPQAEAEGSTGDRDFDDCEGLDGRVWQHPITVFLDDPCSLVSGACGSFHGRALSSGTAHTCVALRDGDASGSRGALRCWGFGDDGRLGYGTTNSIGAAQTPAAAGDVALGGVAIAVAAGGEHTCALLETGALRCWGRGDEGQLGYGNTDSLGGLAERTPDVIGDVALGGAVQQVVAGAYHTCALLDTGAVRCWGENDQGQLGYGHTARIGDDELVASVAPLALRGSVKRLAAGDYHTCALLESGEIQCWGVNNDGQLGYGHTDEIGDDEDLSLLPSVAVGDQVVDIAAGFNHTCAALVGGGVRCWGANEYGELARDAPITVGDDELPADVGVIDIGGAIEALAAGGDHTCALLVGGGVRCWGRNDRGQLGYGNTDVIGDALSPAMAGDVPVGRPVRAIDVGTDFTCALLDSGEVTCWGVNNIGELGSPAVAPGASIGDDETPSQVGHVAIF